MPVPIGTYEDPLDTPSVDSTLIQQHYSNIADQQFQATTLQDQSNKIYDQYMRSFSNDAANIDQSYQLASQHMQNFSGMADQTDANTAGSYQLASQAMKDFNVAASMADANATEQSQDFQNQYQDWKNQQQQLSQGAAGEDLSGQQQQPQDTTTPSSPFGFGMLPPPQQPQQQGQAAAPSGQYADIARQAAQNAGIDPEVFARQIQQESGFDPNAKSPAGAVGIAQIMPSTAQGWGVDPTDPQASLDAAAQHMKGYLDQSGGDWSKALAMYNAGPNVDMNNLPAETQNYISTILGQQGSQNTPSSDSNPQKVQATTDAAAAGAPPEQLAWAEQHLGDQAYIGLCEQFVEKAGGTTGQYASAIDAWDGQKNTRVDDPSLKGIQPGDKVYFAPDNSNGGYGHTGLYAGNGQFISATDNGVRQYDLGQWQKMTGQQPLGYVPGSGQQPQSQQQSQGIFNVPVLGGIARGTEAAAGAAGQAIQDVGNTLAPLKQPIINDFHMMLTGKPLDQQALDDAKQQQQDGPVKGYSDDPFADITLGYNGHAAGNPLNPLDWGDYLSNGLLDGITQMVTGGQDKSFTESGAGKAPIIGGAVETVTNPAQLALIAATGGVEGIVGKLAIAKLAPIFGDSAAGVLATALSKATGGAAFGATAAEQASEQGATPEQALTTGALNMAFPFAAHVGGKILGKAAGAVISPITQAIKNLADITGRSEDSVANDVANGVITNLEQAATPRPESAFAPPGTTSPGPGAAHIGDLLPPVNIDQTEPGLYTATHEGGGSSLIAQVQRDENGFPNGRLEIKGAQTRPDLQRQGRYGDLMQQVAQQAQQDYPELHTVTGQLLPLKDEAGNPLLDENGNPISGSADFRNKFPSTQPSDIQSGFTDTDINDIINYNPTVHDELVNQVKNELLGNGQPAGYKQFFHGTANEFDQPVPSEDGLFGPGYYLTDNPQVAGGTITPEGKLVSPGYAQNRLQAKTLGERQDFINTLKGNLQDQVSRLNAEVQRLFDKNSPFTSGTSRMAARLQNTINRLDQIDLTNKLFDLNPDEFTKQVNDFVKTGAASGTQANKAIAKAATASLSGTNVRPTLVPNNLKLLDADEDAPPDLVAEFLKENNQPVGKNVEITGDEFYRQLLSKIGPDASKQSASTWLANHGYDGIRYEGGSRMPMTNEFGQPILHNAVVIFPESMGKIRNALTGMAGGSEEPKITVRADDIRPPHKPFSDEPVDNPDFYIHKKTRDTFMGKPLAPADVPGTLYHVTSNPDAVARSGVLQADPDENNAGLGKGTSLQHRGVSFTTDEQTANLIKKDMLRAGEVSRTDTPIDQLLTEYAKEDEKASNLPPGTLTSKIPGYLKTYESHLRDSLDLKAKADATAQGYRGRDPEANARLDAFKSYLWGRDVAGGEENPILEGGAEKFKNLNPDTVKVLSVDKGQLPKGALVMRDPLGTKHLNEVRVYGDVPVGSPTAGRSEADLAPPGTISLGPGAAASSDIPSARRPNGSAPLIQQLSKLDDAKLAQYAADVAKGDTAKIEALATGLDVNIKNPNQDIWQRIIQFAQKDKADAANQEFANRLMAYTKYNATEGAPNVQPGNVRLYRGTRAGDTPGNVFTVNHSYARNYAFDMKAGGDGMMHYTDVPATSLTPDMETFKGSFRLPDKTAANATELPLSQTESDIYKQALATNNSLDAAKVLAEKLYHTDPTNARALRPDVMRSMAKQVLGDEAAKAYPDLFAAAKSGDAKATQKKLQEVTKMHVVADDSASAEWDKLEKAAAEKKPVAQDTPAQRLAALQKAAGKVDMNKTPEPVAEPQPTIYARGGGEVNPETLKAGPTPAMPPTQEDLQNQFNTSLSRLGLDETPSDNENIVDSVTRQKAPSNYPPAGRKLYEFTNPADGRKYWKDAAGIIYDTNIPKELQSATLDPDLLEAMKIYADAAPDLRRSLINSVVQSGTGTVGALYGGYQGYQKSQQEHDDLLHTVANIALYGASYGAAGTVAGHIITGGKYGPEALGAKHTAEQGFDRATEAIRSGMLTPGSFDVKTSSDVTRIATGPAVRLVTAILQGRWRTAGPEAGAMIKVLLNGFTGMFTGMTDEYDMANPGGSLYKRAWNAFSTQLNPNTIGGIHSLEWEVLTDPKGNIASMFNKELPEIRDLASRAIQGDRRASYDLMNAVRDQQLRGWNAPGQYIMSLPGRLLTGVTNAASVILTAQGEAANNEIFKRGYFNVNIPNVADDVKDSIFLNKPHGLISQSMFGLGHWMQTLPGPLGQGLGRVLSPFVMVPANMVGQMFEFIPGAGMLQMIGRDSGLYEKADYSKVLAHQILGLAGVGMAWASLGGNNADGTHKLNGAGPINQTEYRDWYAAGNRPWTLNLDGKVVAMRQLPTVLQGPLRMAAAFKDATTYNNTTSVPQDLVQQFGSALADHEFLPRWLDILSQSMSSGGVNPNSILQGLNRGLAYQVGGVVPNYLSIPAEAERTTQPNITPTGANFGEMARRAIEARVPGAEQNVPAKISPAGIPVPSQTSGINAFLGSLKPMSTYPSSVTEWFGKANVPVPTTPSSITVPGAPKGYDKLPIAGNTQLQDRYMQIHGDTLTRMLQRAAPTLNRLQNNPEALQRAISRLESMATKVADAEVLRTIISQAGRGGLRQMILGQHQTNVQKLQQASLPMQGQPNAA